MVIHDVEFDQEDIRLLMQMTQNMKSLIDIQDSMSLLSGKLANLLDMLTVVYAYSRETSNYILVEK